MKHLAAIMAISAVSSCLLAQAAGPTSRPVRDIHEIRSLDDLRAAPATTVSADWQVRLGISEGGSEPCPWKLLFCLAKFTGTGTPVITHDLTTGTVLGPVFFRVEMGAKDADMARLYEKRKFSDLKEALFCANIPMGWAGTYQVTVVAPDNTALATKAIKIEQPAQCYWQKDDGYDSAAAVPHVDGLDPLWVRSSYRPFPVLLVHVDGLDPLWVRSGEQKSKEIPYLGNPLQPLPPLRLPGLVPPVFGYEGRDKLVTIKENDVPTMLKLSLAEGRFVFKPEVAIDDYLDSYLLTRWWVNDKPVVAPRPNSWRIQNDGRRMNISNDLVEIDLILPGSLGALKAGDKVSVQCLYCPHGYDMLRRGYVAHLIANAPDGPKVPLLSNRLDFTITEEMLKVRSASAEAAQKAKEVRAKP